jgi:hypothetical protein
MSAGTEGIVGLAVVEEDRRLAVTDNELGAVLYL